jgi:hypothetical protein
MPNGIGTWGAITADPDYNVYTLHFVDASNDTWTEQLFTALSATAAAVQAWIVLYQLTTQSSIYGIIKGQGWFGDRDPDNAEAGYRGGIEQGINLLFKDPDTRETRPMRIPAPVEDIMQGNQDIPLLSSDALSDLLVATLALQPDYPFVSAQYTGRRERKNNPKVG